MLVLRTVTLWDACVRGSDSGFVGLSGWKLTGSRVFSSFSEREVYPCERRYDWPTCSRGL